MASWIKNSGAATFFAVMSKSPRLHSNERDPTSAPVPKKDMEDLVVRSPGYARGLLAAMCAACAVCIVVLIGRFGVHLRGPLNSDRPSPHNIARENTLGDLESEPFGSPDSRAELLSVPASEATAPQVVQPPSTQLCNSQLDGLLGVFREQHTAISGYQLAVECIAELLDDRGDYVARTPGMIEPEKWRTGTDLVLLLHQREYSVSFDEFPILKRLREMLSLRVAGDRIQAHDSQNHVDNTILDTDITALEHLASRARLCIQNTNRRNAEQGNHK